MLQTIRIWPVVAFGLKTLGESDVAGAGRRIPDCAFDIYKNLNNEYKLTEWDCGCARYEGKKTIGKRFTRIFIERKRQ
uniref:Uncharacterized protein n=1 Tax=Magallana gigas TaxID=29159 RepID=K1QXU6_MAGGI